MKSNTIKQRDYVSELLYVEESFDVINFMSDAYRIIKIMDETTTPTFERKLEIAKMLVSLRAEKNED